ncbi:MAG: glutathione-disulfide reductase, partial [Geminicoccaceae bacterium]|nr:glutathione-disulfide reductase [Geminicoccaceae bacterium]
VGLCEPSRIGGTCVIRGCIPKKLMRYGATFAEHFEAAPAYGWRIRKPEHDWGALIDARDREIERLNGVYIGMLERAGVRLFPERGVLVDEHTVEVGGERFTAERILVAVGARPSLPVLPGVENTITSDFVLEEMHRKPDRVVVVGAGYIGLELASILAGLGVETIMVLRRGLPLRGFDEDVRAAVTEQLKNHGVEIRSDTVVTGIERRGERLALATTAGEIDAAAALYATGRGPKPNTEYLGLESLDLRLTPDGAIMVDDTYRSSVPHIYSVGDCSDHAASGLDSGQFDLTPVAIAEGRVIAETLFNDNPHKVNYETIPTAVFSVPEVAQAGLTEAGARERRLDVEVYRAAFRPLKHTLTGMPVRTMMKMVVDRQSDRVLGCHMVGEDAAEIIQGLAVAMTAGATKHHFDETVGLHPTAAEEFVTMYQAAT